MIHFFLIPSRFIVLLAHDYFACTTSFNKYKYRACARANVRIIFTEICIIRALTVYTALNLPLEEGFDEISQFILVFNKK